MRKLLIIFSTMMFISSCFAQTDNIQFDKWLENISQQIDFSENEDDFNNMIEQLSTLFENPVSINKITFQQLQQIPFISEKQIEELLYYRYNSGRIFSVDELRLLSCWDALTIELIRPLLIVDSDVDKVADNNVKKIVDNVSHHIIIRSDRTIEEKTGYVDIPDSVLAINPNKRYLGDPFYCSLRYRLKASDRISFGLNMEKDAGEKYFTSSYPFADYFSMYLQLKNYGRVRNLILGNYKVKLGCGLLINNCYSLGKSTIVSNLLSGNQNIMPSSSMDEYNYQQGIAMTMKFSTLFLTMFTSFRKIDAVVENDTITSIKKDGKHNIVREADKREKADMLTNGISIKHRGRNFSLGVNAVKTSFSNYYNPALRDYNRFYFRGTINWGISVDYSLIYKHIEASGEISRSDNKAFAVINMIKFRPVDNLWLLLINRYYDEKYNMWYARSFSESGMINNESGCYMQVQWSPLRKLVVTAGADIFRFPYLKYRIDSPSTGYEYLACVLYQASEKISLRLNYRHKSKAINNTDADDNKVIDQYHRQSFSAVINSSFDERISFRTAFYGIFYDTHNDALSKGWAIQQGVGLRLKKIQADIIYSAFDSDDYYSRLYLSDKNVLYGSSFSSFYGNGQRLSFLLRYETSIHRIFDKITFWIKFAQTRYFDRETIGSALEEIKGRVKSDVSVQMRLNF